MDDDSDIPGFEEDAAPPFMTEAEITADKALIAEADADLAAGRCDPHEEVMAWVKTWGAGKRVPPPKSWPG